MKIPMMHICPTKFLLVKKRLTLSNPRILDIGCGNNSPTVTKRWFTGCHYSSADIQSYNLDVPDHAAIDMFYPLGTDGSGYSEIPESSFDLVILHHVLEHMENHNETLPQICPKLRVGGLIWIAFPSLRSLSLPSAEGTLYFCDDPTHLYIPDLRKVSNLLITNGVQLIHAGRSRDLIRESLGALILPYSLLKQLFTGKLSSRGPWYILGFESHVFGQRKRVENCWVG